MTPIEQAQARATDIAGGTLDHYCALIREGQKGILDWHLAYHLALLDILDTKHTPPLTVEQAAQQLNISPSMVGEMTRDGRLPRLAGYGKLIRIAQSDVDALLTHQEDQ